MDQEGAPTPDRCRKALQPVTEPSPVFKVDYFSTKPEYPTGGATVYIAPEPEDNRTEAEAIAEATAKATDMIMWELEMDDE